MTLPALVLGFALATLYGAVFHLWRGGGMGRLILYLILGWIGFSIGQGIATYFEWSFGKVGPLHILVATICSVIFLSVGYWLSLVEVERR